MSAKHLLWAANPNISGEQFMALVEKDLAEEERQISEIISAAKRGDRHTVEAWTMLPAICSPLAVAIANACLSAMQAVEQRNAWRRRRRDL